jgi:surface antigen
MTPRLPLPAFALVLGLAALPALASNVGFMRNSPIANMTKEDLEQMRAATQTALEQTADGGSYRWENSKTGASGVLTPLKTFERDGRTCRNLEIFNSARGFTGRTHYDFCKQPDGSWQSPAPQAGGK